MRGGEQDGPSTRVFVRPVTMLAVGLAGGLAMWWVLMADAGAGGAAAGPPNRSVEAVGSHPGPR
jgi:hypothetical protein